MTESNTWSGTVRAAWAPYGRLVRVENRVEVGTPDTWINLLHGRVQGWCELKNDLTALTLEQVLWLEAETAAGGNAWMLYRAPSAWALYDAVGVRAVYEDKTRAEEVALIWIRSRRFPAREMLRCLYFGPPAPTGSGSGAERSLARGA